MPNEQLGITGKIYAVLTKKDGTEITIPCHNIITDKGDKYYAQKACGETPTDDFAAVTAGLRLGTGVTTPTKADNDVTTFLTGSGKAKTTGYPKTNDVDAANPSGTVDSVTWLYEYTTAEANGTNIIEGAVVDNITTPTGALTHFKFDAPFDKTSSDTLRVFINHLFNGV